MNGGGGGRRKYDAEKESRPLNSALIKATVWLCRKRPHVQTGIKHVLFLCVVANYVSHKFLQGGGLCLRDNVNKT